MMRVIKNGGKKPALKKVVKAEEVAASHIANRSDKPVDVLFSFLLKPKELSYLWRDLCLVVEDRGKPFPFFSNLQLKQFKVILAKSDRTPPEDLAKALTLLVCDWGIITADIKARLNLDPPPTDPKVWWAQKHMESVLSYYLDNWEGSPLCSELEELALKRGGTTIGGYRKRKPLLRTANPSNPSNPYDGPNSQGTEAVMGLDYVEPKSVKPRIPSKLPEQKPYDGPKDPYAGEYIPTRENYLNEQRIVADIIVARREKVLRVREGQHKEEGRAGSFLEELKAQWGKVEASHELEAWAINNKVDPLGLMPSYEAYEATQLEEDGQEEVVNTWLSKNPDKLAAKKRFDKEYALKLSEFKRDFDDIGSDYLHLPLDNYF